MASALWSGAEAETGMGLVGRQVQEGGKASAGRAACTEPRSSGWCDKPQEDWWLGRGQGGGSRRGVGSGGLLVLLGGQGREVGRGAAAWTAVTVSPLIRSPMDKVGQEEA